MNINNPTTFSTPDLTFSTTNSSGSAGALRADDTILAYDATVPTTIAYSASAAAGSASVSSRRDHTHGMAASDAVAQANQTEAEAESDVNKYLPPDLIKNIPGVAKAWLQYYHENISASYNIASVSNTATGEYSVYLATDMSSATYSFASCPTFARLLTSSDNNACTGAIARIEYASSQNDSALADIGDSDLTSARMVFYGDQ